MRSPHKVRKMRSHRIDSTRTARAKRRTLKRNAQRARKGAGW